MIGTKTSYEQLALALMPSAAVPAGLEALMAACLCMELGSPALEGLEVTTEQPMPQMSPPDSGLTPEGTCGHLLIH